ncbi:MAG: type II toxin-antitoxin system VapC family toxin [Betaproteobacteria bacterium]|nr:type II toxin-antitoxin system VapC family toxin [Betaproteobacteria bacterium]
MRLLLDTRIYLWYLADSPKLSREARAEIGKADEVFVSAASIWEAAIKIRIGRLQVAAPELVAGIEASGFAELPVTAKHSAAVADLAPHHNDPFDRLLIAQAIAEPLRLLTADRTLKPYSDLVELV